MPPIRLFGPFVAAVTALVLAHAAVAGPGMPKATPTDLFGNTLFVPAPNGLITRTLFDPNGDWNATDCAGNASGGDWASYDRQLCFVFLKPKVDGLGCHTLCLQKADDSGTISTTAKLSA